MIGGGRRSRWVGLRRSQAIEVEGYDVCVCIIERLQFYQFGAFKLDPFNLFLNVFQRFPPAKVFLENV